MQLLLRLKGGYYVGGTYNHIEYSMKFSLITVTLNSGKTVRNTFDSVLKQTYSDFEYILVDGISRDNTLDLINEYDSKFNGRLQGL